MSDILAITTLRNEGPYLVEWIAHHRALGVDGFLIYSHDCDDGTAELLDALDRAGIVAHRRFTPEPGRSIQFQALRLAARDPAYAAAEWILGIDVDEYAVLEAPFDDLPGLIAALPQADAIALPWRLFGSGGARTPTDAPTPERFLRAAPPDCPYPVAASFFKTLYRRTAFAAPGIHRPRPRADGPAARWVHGGLRPLPAGFDAARGRIQLAGLPGAGAVARLNHYSLRSVAEFIVKSDRGLPNRKRAIDLAYWVERNLNTVEDRTALRFAAAAAAERRRIEALPGVAARIASARAWHAERFATLARQPEIAALIGRIVLAGDSAVPDAATAGWLTGLAAAAHRPGGGRDAA